MDALLRKVRRCTLCNELPLGPKPLLQAAPAAKILIAGQAPGRRTHESGIPFDDASGERLRSWLGVDRETFYDASRIAILPMGSAIPAPAKAAISLRGRSVRLPGVSCCLPNCNRLNSSLPSACMPSAGIWANDAHKP